MRASNIESLQPLLIDVPTFQRFMGRYFLSDVQERADSFGQDCLVLTLSDASGDVTVYCPYHTFIAQTPQKHTMVHIEAALVQQPGEAYFRCKSLIVMPDVKTFGRDFSSLPLSVCPLPDACVQLMVIAARINTPALKDFLYAVLLRTDVGLNYLTYPASRKHHHSFAGGLLQHSVETAWNISGVQAFKNTERDIAVVAALLHDIGKVKTFLPDGRRSDVGKLVDHDQMTLEVCGPALNDLHDVSPYLANQLRHAWTCYTPNTRFGMKPKTLIAELLQQCDRMSAKGELGEDWLPHFDNPYATAS